MLKSSTFVVASCIKFYLVGMFNGRKSKSTAVFFKIIKENK